MSRNFEKGSPFELAFILTGQSLPEAHRVQMDAGGEDGIEDNKLVSPFA